MRLLCTTLLAATSLLLASPAPDFAENPNSAVFSLRLHRERLSPLDLEVSGALSDLPSGTMRYIARDDLLALPQEAFTVIDDPNFTGPTQVSGVPLEELVRHLVTAPDSDLIVAACEDQYRANYPRAYIAAHHPVLVLTINGKPPAGWPKDSEGHGQDMGPYMISHPRFELGFSVMTQPDEPQIPWGVVRLEFRNERAVLGSIAPQGPHAAEAPVQDGYRIARQNCFRCHNRGQEGGQKAGYDWVVLSAWAAASPDNFSAYVRNPQAKNPRAQMPGNPTYNDATVRALLAYFQTFSPQEKP
jgi:mono/diheme cytochrome c family protein